MAATKTLADGREVDRANWDRMVEFVREMLPDTFGDEGEGQAARNEVLEALSAGQRVGWLAVDRECSPADLLMYRRIDARAVELGILR